ncbi:MAG: gliding motility-associated C-terminal domain-containing protein [Bacteroidia bacterium]|nr:gliding motility-associated C-terminal domain-containing protein [Bacteroidia bacterium]
MNLRTLYLFLTFLSISCYAQVNIGSGLVGHYAFDGGNAFDSTASAFHGTLSNPIQSICGKKGNALQFNGINNSIIFNNAINGIFNTADFSISVWYRVPPATSQLMGFITKRTPGAGCLPVNAFDIRVSSSVVGVEMGTLGFDYSTVGQSLPNSCWTHLTVVRQGNTLTSYYNGVLDSQASTAGVANLVNPNCTLTISGGGCLGVDGTTFYNGAIDELRIYNRALNTSEINYLATMYDPTASATPTLLTCLTPTSQLNSNKYPPCVNPNWSPAASLNFNNNIANPIVSPTANTTYTYSYTDNFNCTYTVPVVITVIKNLPNVSAGSNKTITCATPNVALNGSSTTPSVTFNWAGPLGFVSNIPTPTVSVGGIYTLTATNPINGCSSTATVSVFSNTAAPAVSISGSLFICVGQTATITVSGANSYLWNNNSTLATLNISPTVTSVYSVIGTNALNGCTNIAVQTITVNNMPIVSISGINKLCAGQSSTLQASGATTYTWNNGANTSTLLITPSSTSSYTIVGSNSAFGCTNTAVYTITVDPLPTLSINGISSICSGKSTTLIVTGADSYFWNTNQTRDTINVSPTINSIYSVKGTNTLTGCSNTASFAITVNQNPQLSVNGPAVICKDESAALTVTGANTYTWNQTIVSNSIVTSPITLTTYTVIGLNTITGCLGTTIYNLDVAPMPNVTITGKTIVCDGEPLAFTANGASSYLWNSTYTNTTLAFTPTASGTASLTGFNSFGCKNTATVNYTVNPVTKASFITDSVLIDCIYNYRIIGVNNPLIKTYTWYINSDFKSNANELYYPINQNKEETVFLTITNIYGCKSDFNRRISPDNLYENLIYVPNAFTPNSDGLNDTWYIAGECFENSTCYIYNRWGQLLHTLENKYDTWDGSYKGHIVKDDIYTYKLIGNFYNKKAFEKTGIINVCK